jgi:hypothetical protein
MLIVERYLDQLQVWPRQGRHILAQYDENSVVVYQAYKPSIAHWAKRHQRLGGPDFSYGRMSWIKPNFLWMMYRSGWGTKNDQEITLAPRLQRAFFDGILVDAVESSFSSAAHPNKEAWKATLESSEVRLQWDPDHDPHGRPEERRAIQLGLRGEALRRMGQDALLEIIDMSDLVSEQRMKVESGQLRDLQTPRERVYLPGNQNTFVKLGVSQI